MDYKTKLRRHNYFDSTDAFIVVRLRQAGSAELCSHELTNLRRSFQDLLKIPGMAGWNSHFPRISGIVGRYVITSIL